MIYESLRKLKEYNLNSSSKIEWVEIDEETQITDSDNVTLMSKVWTESHHESKLIIKSYTSIANGCNFFLGSNHNFKNITTYIFKDSTKLLTNGDIIVGHDVWIGYGSTIMSGVTIGDGAVIAAGSLVTKNVDPYSIVGGNPAKEIKKRFNQEDIHALLNIKWWNWPSHKIKENIETLTSPNIKDLINLSNRL